MNIRSGTRLLFPLCIVVKYPGCLGCSRAGHPSPKIQKMSNLTWIWQIYILAEIRHSKITQNARGGSNVYDYGID